MKLKNHHTPGIVGPNAKKLGLPVTTKISISWLISATVCLTGYFFARRWAVDQREENLETRRRLNEEFDRKMAPSRLKESV